MNIGVIGLGELGQQAAVQLLNKTAQNLYVYDPDARSCPLVVQRCETAVALLERCDIVILALETAADLTALCNGVAPFLRRRHLLIDLTDISPALAHTIANGMRRYHVRYLECGIFGRNGLTDPFLLFVGGSSTAYAEALPLLRCIAHDCRYMGPAGRGKAARLLCRWLAYKLEQTVEETATLAKRFALGESFPEALADFVKIANPLAELEGKNAAFSMRELEQDAELMERMIRRADTMRSEID